MPFDANKMPGFLRGGDDNYSGYGAEITASDSADQLTPRGTYYKYFMASTAGDVVYVPLMNDDADSLTVTLAAGQVLQARARRIEATGTTATVHGFWD